MTFKKIIIALFTLVILTIIGVGVSLNQIGINPLIWISSPNASPQGPQGISIRLEAIEPEFSQVTDFQFFPESDNSLLVLQKTGELFVIGLEQQSKQLLMKLDVLTDSEQGLLGVAIHPSYPKIPCIYLNTVIDKQNKDISQVSEWCSDWDGEVQRWYQNKVIFEVEQPYKNHNAGHLIFDQAGLLYIPWGDGGSREDPLGNAQNLQSYLGKILRINPEPFNAELPYSIPEDNPFVNNPDVHDEIYAYGLRNPWKLAFDTSGQLIAADVGQDAWEEVTFIKAGANHGWNTIEAMHCFKENCTAENTVLPFIEYGHDVGRSITGGYQMLSDDIPALKNKYIYGDFVSGRLWAANIPDSLETNTKLNASDQAQSSTAIFELGQWPLLISSFARDHSGNIFVADFARGKIYKILPADKNLQ
jgi:glucose/arabinose dehydrogenase